VSTDSEEDGMVTIEIIYRALATQQRGTVTVQI
jgi:hypothetical protein